MSLSRRPVLLVHGFLATDHVMRPLGWRLARRGYDVHYAKLDPLCLSEITRLAHQVGESVERVCAETGAGQVDIVGLSQGGITSLAYVRWLGGAPRVRSLVLVAAPVHGSPVAWAGVPLLGMVSRGIWEMLPGASQLDALTAGSPEGVALTTIAAHGDAVAPPGQCELQGATNHALPLSRGPVTHQWMGFSTLVLDAIDGALSPAVAEEDHPLP